MIFAHNFARLVPFLLLEVVHNDSLEVSVVFILNHAILFDLADDLEFTALNLIVWVHKVQPVLVVQKEIMVDSFLGRTGHIDPVRLELDRRLLALYDRVRGEHMEQFLAATDIKLGHVADYVVVPQVNVVLACYENEMRQPRLTIRQLF